MSKADDLRRSLRASDKKDIEVSSLFINPPKSKPSNEPKDNNDHSANANDNINVSINASTEDIVEENAHNNLNASVNVNLMAIPIAQPKQGIRETHTQKNFYIRNDLAELINEDISKRRGAMTEIVNALFEQYYRSQGRIK
ncbi:hypothetical protein AB1I68_00595 [Paenibacillus pabuli]|uniref:hypothetical protein n=1 Tax=Paenibacillus pabuli TaxID=1472 RepID=UPI0034580AA9